MTITEFLLARIAEDEAAAGLDNTAIRASVGPRSRGRAECAAKRAILADHAPSDESYQRMLHDDVGDFFIQPPMPACRQCTNSRQGWRITTEWDAEPRIVAPCDTIRALASVYADHPDYNPEWAL